MKKSLFLLFPAAFLLLLPSAALAADTSIDSTTILRVEQRDISGSSKEEIVPATQFLGIDVDKLADGNLSAHFYGWGRVDLADKSFNNDRAAGRLTYGYLQYRFKQANADLRAGRFFVREGIANEQVDGISLRTDLPYGFGLSTFGGASVHTAHISGEKSDGKGDTVFGGRASYRYKGMLELGFSGVYESKAPTLVAHTVGDHRLLGGDIWFSPHRMVAITGHTSYNPETSGVAEHSYLISLKPLRDLLLSAEFNEQRDRNYLFSGTVFSGALLNPADKSRTVGWSASYGLAKGVEVSADYKHYTRDLGNADRFGADARLRLQGNSLRSGLAYHYLRAGEGFAIAGTSSASYHELRAYLMHDSKTFFGAVDAIDYIFTKEIFNESSAWELTASLGYHITPALALSGDLSYGRNPQFNDDLRGLARLTYTMAIPGKGDTK